VPLNEFHLAHPQTVHVINHRRLPDLEVPGSKPGYQLLAEQACLSPRKARKFWTEREDRFTNVSGDGVALLSPYRHFFRPKPFRAQHVLDKSPGEIWADGGLPWRKDAWGAQMNTLKTLLLGSAACVIALSGAEAADLPVKSRPVQYVKVCSLYGAGFYYIPGTDTCLKIGGYIRAEYNYNAGGSFTPYVVAGSGSSLYDRTSQTETLRARVYFSADVRSQTEYGTLRAYGTLVTTWSSVATLNNSAGANRAFIQFAGFTLGQATSFFDFFSFANYSNQSNYISSETDLVGWLLAAYTAQFGNGFSATISVEDPRNFGIIDAAAPVMGVNGTYTSRQAGFNGWPDIVANLRVDQSWGSAQIMGALHDVSANYYTGTVNPGFVQGNGYPSDEVGWAAGIGVLLKLPLLGAGDNISAQFTYAEGATNYNVQRSFNIWDGSSTAIGFGADAVYNSATLSGLSLVKSWSAAGGFQHVWNPQWKTSLYSGYAKFEYPDGFNLCPVGVTNCVGSADSAFWQVGTRTVWTPVQNLDLSVDVMYNKIKTAYAGTTFGAGATGFPGSKPAGIYNVGDQDIWAFILRAQRNFWP